MKPKKINIKYSKDLEWLKPFVDHCCYSVPLHKIKSIRSYKVRSGLKVKAYGSTSKEGSEYNINLNVYPFNRIAIILDTLAHELAHVKQKGKNFGKHDSKHFNNQANILVGFSYILKLLKVKDTSKLFNNL